MRASEKPCLERESGVEGYGAATLRRQTKQTGTRDMSQDSAGAAEAGGRARVTLVVQVVVVVVV